MSNERTRPTRETTRSRLFEAAAEVFARRGVAAATVEEITTQAGFTRGAFYSNFETKEQLALAMLEEHLRVSRRYNEDLVEQHPAPGPLIAALRDGDRDDPLHRNPLLQVEIMLHVARTAELRARVGAHLRQKREVIGKLVASAIGTETLSVDAIQIGTILAALEDGLRLHRLVDPASTPKEAFLDSLGILQRLLMPTTEAVSS
jgi:AcrR family transcriptional regulator